ncbi:hypothetical protein ACFYKT_14825 [Cytobacillus sp. FJAT-53684]|uniref:DUF3139 domain-containing protein n=1 Tax=Cytobacillus mangrovibacter TaxID=3299024 RepID=A0ABW6K416_9BACI
MKKVIGVAGLVIIISLVSVLMFTNDFSNIKKVEYQKYNHSNGTFGEVIVIDDNDRIIQITKIFNKGKHQNIQYKKANHESFKLTLTYEDKTTEIIRIWGNMGRDFDLLESDTREGVYKLKDKKSRGKLFGILN